MGKRERSEEAGNGADAAAKVDRSIESSRRFEAYISQWCGEVACAQAQRPSQLPPLTDVHTIVSLASVLCRGGAGAAQAPVGMPAEAFAVPPTLPVRSPSVAGTGIVYDEAMLKHVSEDPKDFERPARLEKTISHLRAVGLLDRCVRLKSRIAKTKELRRAHSREHIDFVDQLDFFMSLREENSSVVGEDLYACEHTSQAARLAAGSVVEAARAVVRGQVANAFAIVRPPGHHAGSDNPSGFCFYNNVAVAARAAQEELSSMMVGDPPSGRHEDPMVVATAAKPRVLILDWDVHHCDGTEAIFYEDPSVLVISIHQYGNGRGHVLRKVPSATPHTTTPDPAAAPMPEEDDRDELSVEALAALLPDDAADDAQAPPASPPPEEGNEGAGRRRRPVVDYNRLAAELQLDDAAAAAMFGVDLSSSSSSLTTSSSSSSAGDGSEGRSSGRGRAIRYAGDTEGLSVDDMKEGRGVDDAPEEDLFYPGTGHLGRIGGEVEPAAAGRNINVPWPAHGFGDLEYLRVLHEVVLPVAREFQPAIVLVSCGFDSARGDLLGSMNLSASGYYAMTKLLSAHLPRLVIALEGGYHVSNVARCSEAVLRALLEDSGGGQSGADVGNTLPPSRMLWNQAGDVIESLRERLRPYWRCL